MSISITMPQMGESVVEGTIEQWLVQEGDRVEKDQIVCEISTDKVDAEIPAPESGVITRILVQEGQTVEVGAELAVLEPGEGATEGLSRPAAEPVTTTSADPTAARPFSAEVVAGESGERRVYSPLVRRMASEAGVDLDQVPAKSADGRVTTEDLQAYLETHSSAPAETPSAPKTEAPPAAPMRGAEPPGTLGEFLSRMRVPTHKLREGDQVTPFSAIRRRIAEHMVVSKIVSPHVGTVAEVDIHRVVSLRESAKAAFQRANGFKLTYLPFIVQATVRALRDFPRMNATVVGDAIVERPGIHVGVAVETERGLVVPVIRDADRLSLVGVASAIEDLATRARERKLSADDLQGGTFTLTNPGREGNLFGLAVINQPQVGILRMGEVKKRPVVVEVDGEDQIAIRPMMYLALSYDHRIIDGVTGNGFLYRVARYLEAGEFEV
jgi:2-oxoglutarate dehydrogenase E2 component (dihydrolipoamide succinyltransferase)